MRKFKLIKEYPGLPKACKVGSIIQSKNPINGAEDSWFEINFGCSTHNSFKLGIDLHPENFPKFWKELEKLVLTSEDGVPLYENDTYFNLFESDFSGELIAFQINGPNKLFSANTTVNKNSKFFSTKEAAEKYVKLNKPTFSKNQINELIGNLKTSSYVHWDNIINDILYGK